MTTRLTINGNDAYCIDCWRGLFLEDGPPAVTAEGKPLCPLCVRDRQLGLLPGDVAQDTMFSMIGG